MQKPDLLPLSPSRVIIPALGFFLAAPLFAQSITHRWSFNGSGTAANGTSVPSSVGSSSGTIVGTGASWTGTSLRLPGTSNGSGNPATMSAFFDLPNSIVSSKTDLTVEIWATIHGTRDWQRLFDFGRVNVNADGNGQIGNTNNSPSGTASRDNLMLAVQRGNSLGQQRLTAKLNNGPELFSDHSVTLATNTPYHFVVTFKSGEGANPSSGGRLRWYLDGAQIGQVDTNFRLNQLTDLNNWLGRSQYTNDGNSNISYDEFRLYSVALSQQDILASKDAGPDVPIIPVAQNDSLILMPGKKALVNVLANDSGQTLPSSVEITSPPTHGTAAVLSDGRILYTHVNEAQTTDSFSYRVSGGGGASPPAAVSITIVNNPKIANPNINVPSTPPTTTLGLVNAFPVSGEPTGGLPFNQPLAITSIQGDSSRLFIGEKVGNVKVIPDISATEKSATTLLNIPSILKPGETLNTASESGLLGVAFHPNFSTAPPEERYFYVFYSVNKSGQLHQRVSRFTALPDFSNVVPNSELILIDQRDEAGNHNGGDLHFGPDGYLYISVGDEGDANDTLFNSQRINKDLFAGILRVDVDKDPVNSIEPTPHAAIPLTDGKAAFSIPKTNPYVPTANGGDWDGTYNGSAVTGTVRQEFWATGLRNPWRMSFDPVTGNLWCADVGQGAREEVNIITRGGNYGWVYREGTVNGPRTTNPTMPSGFDTLYHARPVYEYPRGGNLGGYSVTGGVVYRGNNIPSLTGKYIFGDYGSGNIWSLNLDGTGVQRITGEGGIAGFGYDPSNGDVLLADLDGNRILRLANTTVSTDFPQTLSQTGLFSDLADLSPSPGLVPYEVNLPFWSDHAIKQRWMVIPDGSSSFTPSPDGLWTFPSGTIWVKHFDMEMERGNPSSLKRIETRVFVKNDTGAYGVSYRWNETGTEATLAADGGENFNFAITENNTPTPQTWRIPSRAECMICHTPQAGYALSFNTRQLNLENTIFGVSGNQLRTLRDLGYLSTDLGSPNLLPRHYKPDDHSTTVEARVRSYLAVNCSYCHKEGGSAPLSWDGSPHLPLGDMGLLNVIPTNSGSDPSNRLLVPGDPSHSVILSRVAATNGFSRMPPVGSNVIDQENVDLLTTWISGELNERQDYSAWRTANFDPADQPNSEPTADADGDGMSNMQEFLAGTNPQDGASGLRPDIIGGDLMTLRFSLPTNRSFLVETSSDLGTWTPLDFPGNEGRPVTGGLLEFPLESQDSTRFYRIRIQEN